MDDEVSLQERLRDEITRTVALDVLHHDAANKIDALEAEVADYRKAADDQAMAHKVERDELMMQVAALTKESRPHLSNLLARIHRDGGHYEAEHGTEKAAQDADLLVAHSNMEYDVLREQIAAAIDALTKDAERLNFIEVHAATNTLEWNRKSKWSYHRTLTSYEYQTFKSVREAIDAAIAAQKEQV